jgi:GH25 family lysozyme M1 (1,4-beta-N-acetylmuramidase)
MRHLFNIVAFAATCFLSAPALAVVQGIDVSRYQGTINWNLTKISGVKFAFCKATEGVDYVDPNFTTYMAGAIAAGIPIGPYHFGRVNSGETIPTDAIDEANDFVDAIQDYYNGPGLILRPVLDLENLPDDPVTPSIKGYTSKWVRDFCNTVQNRLGFAPIVYTGGNIAQSYLEPDIANYDLWFAKPTSTNTYAVAVPPTATNIGIWSDWEFWQWSWVGQIIGISGDVDRDVFDGTMQQLAEEFIPGFLAGDYNGDNVVNAADYTEWRNTMGQTVKVGTGADGNLDGVIDAEDYEVWKSGFGNPAAGIGAATTTTIPEPGSFILVVLALSFASSLPRHLARSE